MLIETLHFSGCWLFLKKWNNEIIIILLPPFYFNSLIEFYPPTNLRKNFMPTKFWQVFKLIPPSPPSIIIEGEGGGGSHGLTVSKIQSYYKETVSFVSLSSRSFWYIFDWPRKNQSLSQLGVNQCFWTWEPYIGNPVPKPLGHCLWSKCSWCYI